MYSITPLGERVLRVWMNVIKEERDCLGRVLRRYQATGTSDAVLAEVEGGWAAALGLGWSPVSSTSQAQRARAVDHHWRPQCRAHPPTATTRPRPGATRWCRTRVPRPPGPSPPARPQAAQQRSSATGSSPTDRSC